MSTSSRLFGVLLLFFLTSVKVTETHAFWEWFSAETESTAAEKCSTKESKEKVGHEEVLGTTKRTGISNHGSPFDIEATSVLGNSGRGKELYERSTALSASGNVCWQLAYSGLARSCREILKDEMQKSKLALRLTDCFLKTSGRGGLTKCEDGVHVTSCVKALDDHIHSIFLAFYIDASAMCHYLQSQEFKIETEKLVNELRLSAQNAESTLDSMHQKMDVRHSLIVERAEHILDVQKQMQQEHALLQASIEEGMDGIQEATVEAQEQLQLVNKYQKAIADAQQDLAETLAAELHELQLKSNQMGRSMTNLHGTVEDLTDKSMAGQEEAMKSLTELQSMQLDAMRESKRSMNRLAEDAQRHQEDFRDWQMELDAMHQRLVDGSSKMIKVQESFVVRQAEVFTTIEKLFSLHNAILVESRAAKTVILYFAIAMFIFMATTPKRTRDARLFLYFGLFVTLTFEIWLIRFRMDELNSSPLRFIWPPKRIKWLRYTSLIGALTYLLITIFKFRDYEILSYKMLKDIHGRFGHQAQLQERLLGEYLARCEACKDIPQPNARRRNYQHGEAEVEHQYEEEVIKPPTNRRNARRTNRQIECEEEIEHHYEDETPKPATYRRPRTRTPKQLEERSSCSRSSRRTNGGPCGSRC